VPKRPKHIRNSTKIKAFANEHNHADLILVPKIFEHDRLTGGGENANITEIFRNSRTVLRTRSFGRKTSFVSSDEK
jgi:hypothetical protein